MFTGISAGLKRTTTVAALAAATDNAPNRCGGTVPESNRPFGERVLSLRPGQAVASAERRTPIRARPSS
jgi:hypothetical protein